MHTRGQRRSRRSSSTANRKERKTLDKMQWDAHLSIWRLQRVLPNRATSAPPSACFPTTLSATSCSLRCALFCLVSVFIIYTKTITQFKNLQNPKNCPLGLYIMPNVGIATVARPLHVFFPSKIAYRRYQHVARRGVPHGHQLLGRRVQVHAQDPC